MKIGAKTANNYLKGAVESKNCPFIIKKTLKNLRISQIISTFAAAKKGHSPKVNMFN